MEKIYSKKDKDITFKILLVVAVIAIGILFYITFVYNIKIFKEAYLPDVDEALKENEFYDGKGKLEELLDESRNRLDEFSRVLGEELGSLTEETDQGDENEDVLIIKKKIDLASLEAIDIIAETDASGAYSKYGISFVVPEGNLLLEFGKVNFDNFLLSKDENEEVFLISTKLAKAEVLSLKKVEEQDDVVSLLLGQGLLIQRIANLTAQEAEQYKDTYILGDFRVTTVKDLTWYAREIDSMVEYINIDSAKGGVTRIVFNNALDEEARGQFYAFLETIKL